MKSNHKLYAERKEPSCLVIKEGVDYINIRTCEDPFVLESVLAELVAFGEDAVLVPWLSPPFNTPRGYGIYLRSIAEELARIDLEEHWVSPTLGRKYDKDRIQKMIYSLKD